jgi:hypothetical protein
MTQVPPLAVAPAVHLEFDDNRLLPLLFGEYDQNLARIEQQLGVSLVSRGNQVAISGPAESVDAARKTLNILYQRLKQNQPVERSDVDAVARMARSTGGEGSLFDRLGADGTAVRAISGPCATPTWSSPLAPPAPERPISPSRSPSPCWRRAPSTGSCCRVLRSKRASASGSFPAISARR